MCFYSGVSADSASSIVQTLHPYKRVTLNCLNWLEGDWCRDGSVPVHNKSVLLVKHAMDRLCLWATPQTGWDRSTKDWQHVWVVNLFDIRQHVVPAHSWPKERFHPSKPPLTWRTGQKKRHLQDNKEFQWCILARRQGVRREKPVGQDPGAGNGTFQLVLIGSLWVQTGKQVKPVSHLGSELLSSEQSRTSSAFRRAGCPAGVIWTPLSGAVL